MVLDSRSSNFSSKSGSSILHQLKAVDITLVETCEQGIAVVERKPEHLQLDFIYVLGA